jgi:DNA primase
MRKPTPSFFVNPRENLFYCHGSGQGGDRIRFVQLSQHLSFRQSLAYLEEELAPSARLLEYTAAFYQMELHRYPEGIQYLAQRGVHAAALIETRATPFSVRHNRLAYSISGMP